MLLGFCGHIGAGKTEACLQLRAHGFAEPYSFAAALREAADRLWGGMEHGVYTTQKDEPMWLGITGRECLIRLGNFMRGIRSSYWVDILHDHLLVDNPSRATIDDVRYPNEAELVRELGGYLIRVARPGFEPEHYDETELGALGLVADFNITAVTKGELTQQVVGLVGHLEALEGYKHDITKRHSTRSTGRLHTTERVPAPPSSGDTAVGQGEPGGTSGASRIPSGVRAGGNAPNAKESLPSHEHGAAGGTIPVPSPFAERTQRKPAHERAITEPLLRRQGGDIMKLPCGPTDITWREVEEGYGNHVPFENFKNGTNGCLKCGHVWGRPSEPEEDIIVPQDEPSVS